jgi:hypothetical protein
MLPKTSLLILKHPPMEQSSTEDEKYEKEQMTLPFEKIRARTQPGENNVELLSFRQARQQLQAAACRSIPMISRSQIEEDCNCWFG